MQCLAQCNVNGSGWNSQLTVTSLDYSGAVLLIWQYNTIDDQYIVMHRLIGSINYTISSPVSIYVCTYTFACITKDFLAILFYCDCEGLQLEDGFVLNCVI